MTSEFPLAKVELRYQGKQTAYVLFVVKTGKILERFCIIDFPSKWAALRAMAKITAYYDVRFTIK